MKKTKKKVVKKAKLAARKVAAKKPSVANKAGVSPLGDRVLVKPLSADEMHTENSFGLLIPDSAKEKPEQGTVVAVGPGKRSDTGELVPLGVSVGDRVMFSKYGFDEIKVGGVEYYILPESSILAVIEK